MVTLLPILAQATQPTVVAAPDAYQGVSAIIMAAAALFGSLASFLGAVVGIVLHFSGKAKQAQTHGENTALASQALAKAEAAEQGLNRAAEWLQSHDRQLTDMASQVGSVVGSLTGPSANPPPGQMTPQEGATPAPVPAPAGLVGANLTPTPTARTFQRRDLSPKA